MDNSAESVFDQVSGQFQKQTEGPEAELEPEWVAEQAIIAKQAALKREPSVQESIHTSSEFEENQTSSDESEENPAPQLLQDPQPENKITQKVGSGLKDLIEHIDISSEDYSNVPTISGDQFSKSGFAMTTPKGGLIPLSEVTIKDVSIIHRDPQGYMNRQVYNGANAGEKFKSLHSQTRVIDADKPNWPLVNTFPDSVLHDYFASISVEEFKTHYPAYTVLPDFWKH